MNADKFYNLRPLSFIVGLGLTLACMADENYHPSRTEILASHIKAYKKYKNDQEWNKYSNNLKRDGDEKYIQKDYGGAGNEYGYAQAYLPLPYYYVMSSDTYFRWMLAQINENGVYSHEGQQGPSCMASKEFAYRADYELRYGYEMGFDVAYALRMKKFVASSLYKRSYETATCLRGMINRYSSSKALACIDRKELETCLGEPLI